MSGLSWTASACLNRSTDMESEIKLAWKQGYQQALIDFTHLDLEIMAKLAEDSWKAQQDQIKRGVRS